MDRRDLEKLSHVVLRRIGLKWEWLRLLPGGGNAVDPSTDWQWTANDWEKCVERAVIDMRKDIEQIKGAGG